MKKYHFNYNLFDLEMSPQQRKIATYLQEYLKFNDKTSLPSSVQIAKDTKISRAKLTQSINGLKLQLLKQDSNGIWYMNMPTKHCLFRRVEDRLFKEDVYDYVMIDESIFTKYTATEIEMYVAIKKLSDYIQLHPNYHPCWKVLAEKWGIKCRTLQHFVYKLSAANEVSYGLNDSGYIEYLRMVA